MSLVSIVLPTYNRADTIQRAIRSVQAQTFQDWELIVVDDGSKDQTAEIVTGLDPRLKVIRQANQGVTGARNTGLRNATGRYIAFLDSDDEWLPHHLELSVAFLDAHPDEHFVSCEIWEYFGAGRYVKHYQIEAVDWYPVMAKRIGSHLLDLPKGEHDNYLRIYESRTPIGEWGQAIVNGTPYKDVFHYCGNIYTHWRWGWLMCLQPTMIRREALKRVGFFDTKYPIGSDFVFLANCCRYFPANYLSIPGAIKHELAREGQELREDHIAKGKTAFALMKEVHNYMKDEFLPTYPSDKELLLLLRHKALYLAHLGLFQGQRADALPYLRQATTGKPIIWNALGLRIFATLVPHARICSFLWNGWLSAQYAWGAWCRGEVSLVTLFGRALRRLGGVDSSKKLPKN